MVSIPAHPITQLLRGTAASIDIPPELRAAAEAEYARVGNWLADHADPNGEGWRVYPQGSFLLGTVVQPRGRDEYDLDSVCLRLLRKEQTTTKGLKAEVGSAVKRYFVAHDGLPNAPTGCDERKRCWTLGYRLRFHLDVLPAIPCEDGSRTGILLTDKKLREWQFSDPLAYAEWFKAQMTDELQARRLVLAEARRVEPEAIPEHDVKTTLQLVVQILKLHRNQFFADDLDERPASILVTTLAALAYRGEMDVYDALLDAASRMPEFIERDGDKWTVANPVEPRENFADKWCGNPELATKFFDWLSRLEDDLTSAANFRGLSRVVGRLQESFGQPVRLAAERLGQDYLTERRAGRLAMAPATGALSTGAGLQVKPHEFYGAS